MKNLLTRRSIRQYANRYVDEALLNNLMEQAARTQTMGNLQLYSRDILSHFPTLHLIASGGVSSVEDIRSLEQAGVPSVVFGKAYYEGKIDLNQLT